MMMFFANHGARYTSVSIIVLSTTLAIALHAADLRKNEKLFICQRDYMVACGRVNQATSRRLRGADLRRCRASSATIIIASVADGGENLTLLFFVTWNASR